MIPGNNNWLTSPGNYNQLDAIVGRMVQDLFKFERQPFTFKTKMAMQAIVDRAISDARQYGIDPSQIMEVANRITVIER